jgi:hypothetical protein
MGCEGFRDGRGGYCHVAHLVSSALSSDETAAPHSQALRKSLKKFEVFRKSLKVEERRTTPAVTTFGCVYTHFTHKGP